MFKGKFLEPGVPLEDYGIQDGSIIEAVMKGIGGNGTDQHKSNEVLSECVSCGERADIYCNECEASRCKCCNDQWHRHPKRREHKLKELQIPEQIDSSDTTSESIDEYDKIFSSATDEMIEHATFVATLAEKFKLTSFKRTLLKQCWMVKMLLLFTLLAVVKVIVFCFHQFIKSKKQSLLLLQSA